MLISPPMPNNTDYGYDRFVVGPSGERLRVLMVRTIRPAELRRESNAQFEQRMHGLAVDLGGMGGVLAVEYEIERRAGHAAQCEISVYTEPRAVAVEEDPRPAGAKFGQRAA